MFAPPTMATFAASTIAAAGLGAAAFAATGTASASSADQAFLRAVSAEGIGAETAIHDAQLVCASLAVGKSPISIGNEILRDTNLSSRQAAVLIVAAVKYYCPEYTSAIATS